MLAKKRLYQTHTATLAEADEQSRPFLLSVGKSSLSGENNNIVSNRSQRLAAATQKHKTNFIGRNAHIQVQGRTVAGADKICDSVAESLFRIQDRMERTKNRKLEQLAKKTYALSERHSRLSERSESFSQISYERSEGARAEVRKKAKRTEELKERLRRENKRKGSELNARNLERLNKAKAAREHVCSSYQTFQ